VSIVTKGSLITRDLDVLEALADRNLVHVHASVTSLQDEVAGAMEPRAARPPRRLRMIEQLTDRGIPVGVLIAPVVPGLTDHEIPRIVEAVSDAGARSIGFAMLRLPGAVEPIFTEWLRRTFPARADKVLGRLRSLRGGALNDGRFGRRMRGEGPWANVTQSLFAAATRPLDLPGLPDLDVSAFRPLRRGQLEMTFE
jgi:DNA repair photolyase